MARPPIEVIDLSVASAARAASDANDHIDPTIQCGRCQALCCRLTVVVMPDDLTPEYWIDQDESGMEVMRRLDDGWCAALDRERMQCSIYEVRPQICRDFRMGGYDCRSERDTEKNIR
jgi:Fe-S-cluster containining protein